MNCFSAMEAPRALVAPALAALLAGCQSLAGGNLAKQSNETAVGRPKLVAAQLPLHFEANQGQADKRVQFLARGDGYVLFLTHGEAVLALRAAQGNRADEGMESAKPSVLHMKLDGANLEATPEGLDALAGKVNYFIGNNPQKWRTSIPTYAKVHYRNVYPGVDLVYYGNQGQLEYDFIVAPGVDPSSIRLSINGVETLQPNDHGDLVLRIAGGELRMHRPLVYQEVDGARKRVEGAYVIKGKDQVGFEVAAFDDTRPLVIDPVLSYSTYLGGRFSDGTASHRERGVAMTLDAAGHVYLAGITISTDFPVANALQPASGDGGSFLGDAFVAKLNPGGTAFVYSTYLGGNGVDGGSAIATDAQGNAYVTGRTSSTNFPTVNPVQPAYGGGSTVDGGDVFVAKLDATGSALLHSTYLGGAQGDSGLGIAVGTSRNVFITGTSYSADFPIRNALQPTVNGNDVFKSDSGGVTWSGRGLGNRGIRAFAIHSSNPETIYAGTQAGIFKSIDGTASWVAISAGLSNRESRSVWSLAIDQLAPSTLYAGTEAGVFKSSDGGAGWSAINAGLPADVVVTAIAIDPAASTIVYAGTSGAGVFKTVDGGQNWTAASAGLGQADVTALVIDPLVSSTLYAGTRGGVFKTINGGLTWSASSVGIDNTVITELAIDPRMPFVVYAGTQRVFDLNTRSVVGGIFKSLNGGLTWTKTSTGIPAFSTSIAALAIDPVTPQILYASATAFGVYKSIDGGLTWVRTTGDVNKQIAIAALAVDPIVSSVVYAGSVIKRSEAFVAQLDSGGSALIYSTYLGGSDSEWGRRIVADALGNAYVTGGTLSGDFPVVAALQASFGGQGINAGDAFVAKLNPAGSALVYSTYLGGSGSDEGVGVVLDADANAYVTGFTDSTNFPTVNPLQATRGGGSDAFVVKIDPSGGRLVYSTYFGGSSEEYGYGIALDGTGSMYVTGRTSSTDFPALAAVQQGLAGNYDAFVSKLNPSGSAILWSTFLGGSDLDVATDIALDGVGGTYIAGTTCSRNFPVTANALQPVAPGCYDGFVTRINEP